MHQYYTNQIIWRYHNHNTYMYKHFHFKLGPKLKPEEKFKVKKYAPVILRHRTPSIIAWHAKLYNIYAFISYCTYIDDTWMLSNIQNNSHSLGPGAVPWIWRWWGGGAECIVRWEGQYSKNTTIWKRWGCMTPPQVLWWRHPCLGLPNKSDTFFCWSTATTYTRFH